MTTLEVFVTSGCPNCDFARELAAGAAQAFPAVSVRVLELGGLPDPPEEVFATPTYLLDGKIAYLGNPDRTELFELLARALDNPSASAI